jgi:hypothetical protein
MSWPAGAVLHVQVIYNRNQEVMPLLMVATVWYLVILSVLSFIQRHIERHYARGALRNPAASVIDTAAAPGLRRSRRPATAGAASPRRRQAPAAPLRLACHAPRPVAARSHPGVSKSFGPLKVLDDVSLTLPPGSVTVDSRPVGLGQVDAAALDQPSGARRRRLHRHRRRADRLPAGRRHALRAEGEGYPRGASMSAWCSRTSTCSRI